MAPGMKSVRVASLLATVKLGVWTVVLENRNPLWGV